MARPRDPAAQLAPLLARYQLHLVGLRAELASSPSLTVWGDDQLDPGAALDPVLRAIEGAAIAVAAPPQTRFRRGTLVGELSVLWADVIEIEPARIQRRWRRDVPAAWPEAHQALLETVEEALEDLRQ